MGTVARILQPSVQDHEAELGVADEDVQLAADAFAAEDRRSRGAAEGGTVELVVGVVSPSRLASTAAFWPMVSAPPVNSQAVVW
jgi:hypothetical protein